MNRDQIIEAIASASEVRHRDNRDIIASRLYSSIEAGQVPGVMLATANVDKMMRENMAMKKAIAFATSPAIWVQRETDIYQYCHKQWYADVLKKALESGNEDAKSPRT